MESRKLLDKAKAKIQADVEIRKAQMNSKIAEANLAAQEATLKVKVIALVEDKSKRELQTSSVFSHKVGVSDDMTRHPANTEAKFVTSPGIEMN